jgi:hypothetical protein
MTTFKNFCQRYPVSGILCRPAKALDEERSLVKLSHIMPLPEKCAKWHKIICILFVMPECPSGMMLIINVSDILRYDP